MQRGLYGFSCYTLYRINYNKKIAADLQMDNERIEISGFLYYAVTAHFYPAYTIHISIKKCTFIL
jgi:hypothetical protein